MIQHRRAAFTLFELLTALALLVILFGLMLPAVGNLRLAAARSQSANNLKQMGLAVHSYYDTMGSLPPGCDDNHFSAFALVLPYIEQQNVYNLINFKKPVDAKENAEARKIVIKTFLNPLDPVMSVSMDYGPTNYLFCAGSQYSLDNNDGLFFLNSKVRFPDVTDGLSNTMMIGETLKGDSGVRAMDVKRQHVLLKAAALKDLNDDSGVKEWKADKMIAADRCASWMDGAFSRERSRRRACSMIRSPMFPAKARAACRVCGTSPIMHRSASPTAACGQSASRSSWKCGKHWPRARR